MIRPQSKVVRMLVSIIHTDHNSILLNIFCLHTCVTYSWPLSWFINRRPAIWLVDLRDFRLVAAVLIIPLVRVLECLQMDPCLSTWVLGETSWKFINTSDTTLCLVGLDAGVSSPDAIHRISFYPHLTLLCLDAGVSSSDAIHNISFQPHLIKNVI